MTDRPIRVCLLLARYPPDFTGWGIQFQRLLPHLTRQGVAARVVTRRPAAGVEGDAGDTDSVWRILPAPDEPCARLRGVARLRAHLRRHRADYDVVHGAFDDWEFFLNVPWLRRRGVPVLHEMVLFGGDDPLTIRAQRLGALKLRLIRDIDAWVGISLAFLPRVVGAGIPAERFHCLYPGIDLERYRPADEARRQRLRAAFDIPPDARVVVSAGTLMPRKGMDRLLRAWARVGPRPGRDLLLLVGPASQREGLRPQYLPHVRELEELARSPELAGTVRLVGRVHAMEDWMAASDVFALLSRREGFGIVIAEAMACGLPCLVSPLDGIAREIVEEGRSGFILEAPDDAEAVAAALRLLLADPERRRALGETARARARERFSMEVRAATLAALWRRLARA